MTGINFTVPVSVVTRTVTGRDSRGDDTFTEVPTPVVGGGVFAPGGSAENTQGQDQVVTQPTVYLPNVPLTASDVLIVDGVRWQVDGDPRLWPANAFTGWQPEYPLEVPLRKVTG